MGFRPEDVEHLIIYALREKGLDSVLNLIDPAPVTRYIKWMADMHQRIFNAFDEGIDNQMFFRYMEEFDEETSIFMRSLTVAVETGSGRALTMAEVFGGERTGRPEHLIYIASKFIVLFAMSWLALNVMQNAERNGSAEPQLLKLKERPIKKRI